MKKFTLIFAALIFGLLLLLVACKSADISSPDTEGDVLSSVATEAYTDADSISEPNAGTNSETVTEGPSQTETEGEESFPIYTPPVETEAPQTEPETYEAIQIPEDAQIYQMHTDVRRVGEIPVEANRLPDAVLSKHTHIRVILPLGYACRGFEVSGIRYEGDTIPVAMLKATPAPLLLIEYATYELPILHISVGGKSIESKTEYVDMTLSLENTEDVLLNMSGGIRLRGNSTAGYIKKPYRIRFDQKQSLFGLDKAKSWVLLAEYLDPSCMHNYAAMYLGQASDALAFTPTIHQVNLYLDGEYMGIYSLCEQVEEKEGRLDLEIPITADMTKLMDFNFLVCMDERAPEYPGAKRGETYFFIPSVGRYFELKYPRKEDFVSEAQFKKFFGELQAYYEKMADCFLAGNANWMGRNIHVESLIDHLIVDQIMGEKDHVWKSFYTYHEKREESRAGRISFGPIWDYDYSLYTPWTGEPNVSYEVGKQVEYSNFFFQGLMKSRLASKVKERYNALYADVLSEAIKEVQNYRDSIAESLVLNQERWYRQDPNLTDRNADFLLKFLKSRQKVLRQAWA